MLEPRARDAAAKVHARLAHVHGQPLRDAQLLADALPLAHGARGPTGARAEPREAAMRAVELYIQKYVLSSILSILSTTRLRSTVDVSSFKDTRFW